MAFEITGLAKSAETTFGDMCVLNFVNKLDTGESYILRFQVQWKFIPLSPSFKKRIDKLC